MLFFIKRQIIAIILVEIKPWRIFSKKYFLNEMLCFEKKAYVWANIDNPPNEDKNEIIHNLTSKDRELSVTILQPFVSSTLPKTILSKNTFDIPSNDDRVLSKRENIIEFFKIFIITEKIIIYPPSVNIVKDASSIDFLITSPKFNFIFFFDLENK